MAGRPGEALFAATTWRSRWRSGLALTFSDILPGTRRGGPDVKPAGSIRPSPEGVQHLWWPGWPFLSGHLGLSSTSQEPGRLVRRSGPRSTGPKTKCVFTEPAAGRPAAGRELVSPGTRPAPSPAVPFASRAGRRPSAGSRPTPRGGEVDPLGALGIAAVFAAIALEVALALWWGGHPRRPRAKARGAGGSGSGPGRPPRQRGSRPRH